MTAWIPAGAVAGGIGLLTSGPLGLARRAPVAATQVPGRWRGRSVVVGVPVVLAMLIVPAVTVAGVSIGLLVRFARVRRRSTTASAELADQFPDLLHLLGIGLRAGLPLGSALDHLARTGPPPYREALTEVLARHRLGERLADSLSVLAERHPIAGDLTSALARCERYGDPVAPLVDRLNADALTARRQRLEAHARRLPVRLSFPLVACVLPSFAVLALAPILLGALTSLRLP